MPLNHPICPRCALHCYLVLSPSLAAYGSDLKFMHILVNNFIILKILGPWKCRRALCCQLVHFLLSVEHSLLYILKASVTVMNTPLQKCSLEVPSNPKFVLYLTLRNFEAASLFFLGRGRNFLKAEFTSLHQLHCSLTKLALFNIKIATLYTCLIPLSGSVSVHAPPRVQMAPRSVTTTPPAVSCSAAAGAAADSRRYDNVFDLSQNVSN